MSQSYYTEIATTVFVSALALGKSPFQVMEAALLQKQTCIEVVEEWIRRRHELPWYINDERARAWAKSQR